MEILNDLVTVGVGWNLSGDDAGEWLLVIGPSVEFKFQEGFVTPAEKIQLRRENNQ